jgi:hypothetical protein
MGVDLSSSFSSKNIKSNKLGWVISSLAIIGFFVISYFVFNAVKDSSKQNLKTQLATILSADVEALRIWLNTQERTASVISGREFVVNFVENLVLVGNETSHNAEKLETTPAYSELQNFLAPLYTQNGYVGFLVTDANGWHVASSGMIPVGTRVKLENNQTLARVLDGETIFGKPFLTQNKIDGKHLELMFVSAPVRDQAGEIIAALSFVFHPNEILTPILNIARPGETGETFAFDENGLFLSGSRFDAQLKELGLIENSPNSVSALQLEARDPGGDLSKGYKSEFPRKAQPLTKMASLATTGESGEDIEGYRNYQGKLVVGAWQWLEKYQIGIATEIEYDEAYAPLNVLQRAVWMLIFALAVAVLGLLIFSFFLARTEKRALKAEHQAKKLGRYALGKVIGEGGMGQVYEGHHDMLQRPTAVKVLRDEKTNPKEIARFEREVQLTCRLTHANTITIYDYGRTPEGEFYYAMEYLKGLPVDQIIHDYGAIAPTRVIRIFRQVAESLREAHNINLIHRDIKPGNIMLCVLGGVPDFVKVLDFGLVKSTEEKPNFEITGELELCGTPMFLAPELIKATATASPLTDIYALGISIYQMITGKAPFEVKSYEELWDHHFHTVPILPSEMLGRSISPQLEELVMKCLEKDPKARPQSMDEILSVLKNIPETNLWNETESFNWWKTNHQSALQTQA